MLSTNAWINLKKNWVEIKLYYSFFSSPFFLFCSSLFPHLFLLWFFSLTLLLPTSFYFYFLPFYLFPYFLFHPSLLPPSLPSSSIISIIISPYFIPFSVLLFFSHLSPFFVFLDFSLFLLPFHPSFPFGHYISSFFHLFNKSYKIFFQSGCFWGVFWVGFFNANPGLF